MAFIDQPRLEVGPLPSADEINGNLFCWREFASKLKHIGGEKFGFNSELQLAFPIYFVRRRIPKKQLVQAVDQHILLSLSLSAHTQSIHKSISTIINNVLDMGVPPELSPRVHQQHPVNSWF